MRDEELLVKVEEVSKKFCKSLKRSLWYGVKDITSEIFGQQRKQGLRGNEFWAVDDVSFELRRGECLGLIGHNGAGKSTLLKMLNGLIKPDKGKIELKGRVGALIELGTGFNPILTGRENVYNNAAVLGFTREEVDQNFDKIIEFSEIGDFIDSPVQNYSSGMKVRLGFAVAAQMEPDILLIDEVLAVGDVGFRSKCYDRIFDLLDSSAVIFVSHSMPQISKLCSEVLFMDRGKKLHLGKSGDSIELYYNKISNTSEKKVLINSCCQLVSFSPSKRIIENYESNLNIEIVINCNQALDNLEINVVLLSRELIPVAQASTKFMDKYINFANGSNRCQLEIENLNLNTGKYYWSLTVDSVANGKKFLWIQNIDSLDVKGNHVGVSPLLFKGNWILD